MTDTETVILTYGVHRVMKITGLTLSQLSYWDKTGFFQTEFSKENRGIGYERVYSFKDVVSLRTLQVLRNEHGVSLHHLRKVAEKLSQHSNSPWSDLKLMVVKKEVVFIEPETGTPISVIGGQYAMLSIIDVIDHVKTAADSVANRKATQIGAFEKHRSIAHNALVFSGTRVQVKSIVGYINNGYSIDHILKEYPRLTREDIIAVVQSAASLKAA